MEHQSHLNNRIYNVVDQVMCLIALRQTRKPRSDYDIHKARHSVSSLSTHHYRSSSHQEDDDDNEGISRASNPSLTTYLNSLSALNYENYDILTSSKQDDDVLFEGQTTLLNQTQKMHELSFLINSLQMFTRNQPPYTSMASTRAFISKAFKRPKINIIPPKQLFVNLTQDDTKTPSAKHQLPSPSAPNASLKTPSTKNSSSSSIDYMPKSPTSFTLPSTNGYLNSPASSPPRVPPPLLTQQNKPMEIIITPSPLFGHLISWNLLNAHGATCLFMCPIALRQTRKPRSDYGIHKARHSVSSLSTHHYRSSSHQEDNDDNEGISRASNPSLTTYLNSLLALNYYNYDILTSSKQDDDVLFEGQTTLLNQTQKMHELSFLINLQMFTRNQPPYTSMASTRAFISKAFKRPKINIIPPKQLFVNLTQDDTKTPSAKHQLPSPSAPNASLKTPSTKNSSSSSIDYMPKSPTSFTLPSTNGYLNSPASSPPRVPPPLPTQQIKPMEIIITPSPLFGHLISWNLLNAHGATCLFTAASTTITTDTPQLTTAAAPTLTTAPSAAKRRKGVVIKDPQETATPSTIVHSEAKSKDKGKGILVEEPKPLKKQAQIEQDEAYARELEAELIKNIDWDELILLVERRYPLTRFTLDQMLNNVRLEVEEESEVSLELLSFGVDVAKDFKENMLSDYYCQVNIDAVD
nr:hypothetical protein [Tanacetum cinerariifolium]